VQCFDAIAAVVVLPRSRFLSACSLWLASGFPRLALIFTVTNNNLDGVVVVEMRETSFP
jgi:hypothetical protein